MATLYPWPQGGIPSLAGGTINTYQAGTTTPLATYTDSTASTPLPTSIGIDINGFPSYSSSPTGIWLGTTYNYKFIIKNSNGTQVGPTIDNISGLGYSLQSSLLNTNLNVNGYSIISLANGNIAVTPNGTGQTQITHAYFVTPIQDVNKNNIYSFSATTSSVNYMQINNAATGTNPTYTPVGTDSNIGINWQSVGTGTYNFLDNSTQVAAIKLGAKSAAPNTVFGTIVFPTLAASITCTLPAYTVTMPATDLSNGILVSNGSGTWSFTTNPNLTNLTGNIITTGTIAGGNSTFGATAGTVTVKSSNSTPGSLILQTNSGSNTTTFIPSNSQTANLIWTPPITASPAANGIQQFSTGGAATWRGPNADYLLQNMSVDTIYALAPGTFDATFMSIVWIIDFVATFVNNASSSFIALRVGNTGSAVSTGTVYNWAQQGSSFNSSFTQSTFSAAATAATSIQLTPTLTYSNTAQYSGRIFITNSTSAVGPTIWGKVAGYQAQTPTRYLYDVFGEWQASGPASVEIIHSGTSFNSLSAVVRVVTLQ